jgi:hypothetical protein
MLEANKRIKGSQSFFAYSITEHHAITQWQSFHQTINFGPSFIYSVTRCNTDNYFNTAVDGAPVVSAINSISLKPAARLAGKLNGPLSTGALYCTVKDA